MIDKWTTPVNQIKGRECLSVKIVYPLYLQPPSSWEKSSASSKTDERKEILRNSKLLCNSHLSQL